MDRVHIVLYQKEDEAEMIQKIFSNRLAAEKYRDEQNQKLGTNNVSEIFFVNTWIVHNA
jgi:hypothetical protein